MDDTRFLNYANLYVCKLKKHASNGCSFLVKIVALVKGIS